LQPSRIVFNLRRKELIFSDIENLKIRFTPLEATLYYFYLKHEEGVMLKDLKEYNDEIYEYYMICNVRAVTLSQVENNVKNLINDKGKSFIEKKSRINRKLKKELGKKHAGYYVIRKSDEDSITYKIIVDRDLVTLTGDKSFVRVF
jgi:hypothetical protein